MWHDVEHSFLWVWVCASQRIPWSVLARNPHKRRVREITHDSGRWRGKGRSQSRTEESTEHGSRQKLGEADGQRKTTARTCGSRGWVGQRERMSQRSWWLCENFAGIHARDSSQMHRKLGKSVINFFLLALWVRVCYLFLSILSVLYIVFCVFLKKCEIPLAGNKRNHWAIGWPWVV